MTCRLRPAFTLPEVLLATMLLALGIVALASSATYIAIEAADSRDMLQAAQLSGSILDSLRSVPCTAVSGGSLASGSTVVTWTVAAGPGTRALQATLVTSRRARQRGTAIDALLPCES